MFDSLCLNPTPWKLKLDLRAYKGKSESAPEPPKPVNSEYWQDGNLTGKTTLIGNVQKQESFMTPFEKSQQTLQQQYLPQFQQKLLNPDQSAKDSWKAMADASKANEMKAFNVDYGKAQNDLIQNLSSRGAFGGRSAGSSQVDYFGNELAKTAADQLDTINNRYTSNLDNYEANYNNKISNILNILNGYQTQQQQVNQNNVGTAMNGFNAGNGFNQGNYQAQMNQSNMERQLQAQKQAAMWGAIGNTMPLIGAMGAKTSK